MTYRTPVRRTTAAPPYESRAAYMRSLPGPHRICNVETDPNKPWLTLVLGSGCTTSKNQVETLLQTAAQLEATVLAWPQRQTLVDGCPLAGVVRHFAEDLIADRLRLTTSPRIGASPAQVLPEEDKWVAEVFAGAALLTKLYFQTKSVSGDAPRRPDHEDEAVLSSSSTSWWVLKEECIDPCHEVIERLRDQVEVIATRLNPGAADEVRATIDALMERLIRLLNPGEHKPVRVALWDLQSVAEFAWLSITTITDRGASVYPGWSDLLLHLSNYNDIEEGRVGMPLFRTMSAAQDIIRTRYARITRAAWESPADALHIAAAKLLIAEEQFRRPRRLQASTRTEPGEPPLATAFVTSFDVELELALLRETEPFTVALPVHVVNTVDTVAHTSWLAIRVPGRLPDETAEQSFKKLTEPDEAQISILGVRAVVDGPVVVRLAGCPLIKLPELRDAGRLHKELIVFFEAALKVEANWKASREPKAFEKRLARIKDTLSLEPAVVINEHDAILQNELDLLPTGEGPSGDESDSRDKRFGLHPGVTAGAAGWARFWMLLGVQISDSAVRQRIATLVSATSLTSDPHIRIDRSGIAVNAHITALEQDLLFWNGFDVVTDDAADFAGDLKHYAAHLDAQADFTEGACDV